MMAGSPLVVSAQTTNGGDTIQAKKKVHVAFRDKDADQLLGGVSYVDMEELQKKDYTMSSLEDLYALVGGWNGSSLWGMDTDQLDTNDNTNLPVVIIDGVKRPSNNVLPSEIEQVTFLKGAQAVAAAVFLLRQGMTRDNLRAYIEQHFYPLRRTLDQIRPTYAFDGSCQGTVPQAFQAFLESTSFEDALRGAVSLGGDTDTLTAIACSIAWAYYARRGPDEIMLALSTLALEMLPADLRAIVSGWESRVSLSPKAL